MFYKVHEILIELPLNRFRAHFIFGDNRIVSDFRFAHEYLKINIVCSS